MTSEAPSPQPQVDPQNKMIAYGLVGSGVAFILGILLLLFIIPRPEKFYVSDPANEADVRELMAEIDQKLTDLEERAKSEGESILNATDEYWPRDRYRIVQSIQVFRLKHSRLPETFSELLQTGALAPEEISSASRFEVIHKPNRWDLVVNQSQRIAVGN